jgi:hypothetical protein
MKINYFNADHTHALVDLPTNRTIEQVVQLLKGGSSHWINDNRLVRGRFAWDEATELFQSRTRISIEFANTSRIKASIIARKLLKKNISSSLSVTGWNGARRKTVETVTWLLTRSFVTRLKPGATEKCVSSLRFVICVICGLQSDQVVAQGFRNRFGL